MTTMNLSGVIAATGLLAFSVMPASAHSHCTRQGVSATAVTSVVATLVAKEGLYNSNMFAGRMGKGPISVDCKYIGVVTTCTARQIACK